MPPDAQAPKRKRGRPRISPEERFYPAQDCYIAVEVVKRETLATTGRLRSAAEACRLLATRGGLAWIAGGDISLLPPLRGSKQPRCNVYIDGDNLAFRRQENGSVYVERLIQHPATIESRYDESVRWAKADENIRFAWDNMVRERCGLPRLPPKSGVFFSSSPVNIDLAKFLSAQS